MNKNELNQLIGFGPGSHLTFLRKLWLLYRAPRQFRTWFISLPYSTALQTVFSFNWHLAPYCLFWGFVLPCFPPMASVVLLFVLFCIAWILAVFAFSLLVWRKLDYKDTRLHEALHSVWSIFAAMWPLPSQYWSEDAKEFYDVFSKLNEAHSKFRFTVFMFLSFCTILADLMVGSFIGISFNAHLSDLWTLKLDNGITSGGFVWFVFAFGAGVGGSIVCDLLNNRDIYILKIFIRQVALLFLIFSVSLLPVHGVAATLTAGLASSLGLYLGATRGYYQIGHLFFVWPRYRGNSYALHPIAWDDCCMAHLPMLDGLLVDYYEINPNGAIAEIQRLIDEYPSQHQSAVKALFRITIRRTSKVTDLSQLPGILSELPEGDDFLLKQTAILVEKSRSIGALYDRLQTDFINMPPIRLQIARQLCEAIETFRNQVSGFQEPIASELRAAAVKWLDRANSLRHDVEQIVHREPFPQVFNAREEISRERKEAFIPRQDVTRELVARISASSNCPGMLLYGRRKTGKSTCLQNLIGFIPEQIDVAFLNVQSPECSSLPLFVSHVENVITAKISAHGHQLTGRSIDNALAQLPNSLQGNAEQLAHLSRFLAKANEHLENNDRKLLVALDEFEYLDQMMGKTSRTGEPCMPESILDVFRTSIRRDRNLIWLFSGAHRISELKYADWTTYFISLRTLELGRFSLSETVALLTDPLAYSEFFKGIESRPRFAPEFWGTDGIRRLHYTADGWPYLVVLLAEICVDMVNQHNTSHVTDDLWAAVVDRAVVEGEVMMIRVLKHESEIAGEWDYLLKFRERDVLPLPDDHAIRKSLVRRTLVSFSGNEARFKIPLLLHWIRRRSGLCE